MADHDVCLYSHLPGFLLEPVSKCVHPIHGAMIAVVLSDLRSHCEPVTMVCPASAAGVISTIQGSYYVNVLEETSSGENINSCKDRTHLLKK